MTIVVRRFEAAEWPEYRKLRLRSLADSPDAFGSTLDREAERRDEEYRDRLARAAHADRDLPLLALVDGVPAGLSWGRIDDQQPDTVHLYQVWVAPEYRGRGVGQALLDAVIAWSRASGARRLRLGVTRGDSAAVRLYRRAGFVETGYAEPLRPGSALMCDTMHLLFE